MAQPESAAFIKLTVRDPAHLEAHRQDFLLPLGEVLAIAREALIRRRAGRLPPATAASGTDFGQPLWECFPQRCPRAVGRSGLATLRPWTRGDYWACRPGRNRPSHLIPGRLRPTRNLCIWGYWESADNFVIHTLYPGVPAPREIHDPELPVADLAQAIRFWTEHAIIVERS